MNLSLKPNPLIALWLPGTLLVLTIAWTCPYITIQDKNISKLFYDYWGSINVGLATLIIFIISLLGFIVGELLDSVRDIIEEHIIDRFKKHRINWDYFFEGDEKKITNLEEWYYTYYELDFNSTIGILIIFILKIFCIVQISWIIILILIFPLSIFFFDMKIMRGEIVRLTNSEKKGAQNDINQI
jgi:hypothetical protein